MRRTSSSLLPGAYPGMAVASIALMALSYAPLLAIHGRLLWDRPYYRFFPLVLIGAIALVASASKALGPLAPGGERAAASALALAWGLLGLAWLFTWPWLAAVAAMAGLAALIYDFGGRRLLRALLPAWVFLLLVIPPPLELDRTVVGCLQDLTMYCVSPSLDGLGLLHVVEGRTVNVEGKEFLIEEACSGVNSLLVTLAGAAFLVIWAHRPLVWSLLLLIAATGWTFLANAGRCVAVAALEVRWGIAASTGWRHETLGFVAVVTAMGLVLSTDRLLAACAAAARFPWFWPEDSPQPNYPTDSKPIAPTSFDLRRTRMASPLVAIAFGFLALAQWIRFAPVLPGVFFSAERTLEALRAAEAGNLPANWQEFQRMGFDVVERETDSDLGASSRRWEYRGASRDVAVSVDFPFRGWHELTLCYQGLGWDVSGRRVIPPKTGESGVIVEANLKHPDGRDGWLIFTVVGDSGKTIRPPTLTGALDFYIMPRLRFWQFDHSGMLGRCVQFQLLMAGEGPISDAERQEGREFFKAARRSLESKLGRRNE
jgi:exosortase